MPTSFQLDLEVRRRVMSVDCSQSLPPDIYTSSRLNTFSETNWRNFPSDSMTTSRMHSHCRLSFGEVSSPLSVWRGTGLQRLVYFGGSTTVAPEVLIASQEWSPLS